MGQGVGGGRIPGLTPSLIGTPKVMTTSGDESSWNPGWGKREVIFSLPVIIMKEDILNDP